MKAPTYHGLYKKYLDGWYSDNVHCGHVDWQGNVLSGCHKLTKTYECRYFEDPKKYGTLQGSVHFCKSCLSKYLKKYAGSVSFDGMSPDLKRPMTKIKAKRGIK